MELGEEQARGAELTPEWLCAIIGAAVWCVHASVAAGETTVRVDAQGNRCHPFYYRVIFFLPRLCAYTQSGTKT